MRVKERERDDYRSDIYNAKVKIAITRWESGQAPKIQDAEKPEAYPEH